MKQQQRQQQQQEVISISHTPHKNDQNYMYRIGSPIKFNTFHLHKSFNIQQTQITKITTNTRSNST